MSAIEREMLHIKSHDDIGTERQGHSNAVGTLHQTNPVRDLFAQRSRMCGLFSLRGG